METLWNNYGSCQDSQEKARLWKDLLPICIKDCCILDDAALNFRAEFANEIARKFLSAIYEQCSVAEDEPDGLMNFLSDRDGCHLILALNSFAPYVTSCCDELCNLLLSIIPLALQDENGIDQKIMSDLFGSTSAENPSQYSNFLYISRKLCKLPTDILCTTSVSSDDEIKDANQTRSEKLSEAELLEQINKMNLLRHQLFFNLISTVIGLVQNDAMSNENDSFVTYLNKCCDFLSPESVSRDQEHKDLMWFHQHGITQLALILMFLLSSSEDGLAKILSNAYYTNFYQTLSRYARKASQPIYMLLSVNLLLQLTVCILQSLQLGTISPSHNSDLLDLTSKFSQLNFLELLKKIMVEVDSRSVEYLESNLGRQCLKEVDLLLKQLVKITKQVKCMKGYCDEVMQKGYNATITRVHSIKESATKVSRKYMSSDEEKAASHRTSSLSDGSAKNVSDFDELLFDESSDSAVERRLKQRNVTKSVEIAVNVNKEDCFISKCTNALSECFVRILHHQQIQLILLHSMAHVGVCRCIDLDPFLVPIVSCLVNFDEKVMDKTLSFVCYLLSSNWDMINQKSACKRRLSSRRRVKSRTQSSTSTTYDDTQDEQTENSSSSTTQPPTYHFLTKFKIYLTSPMPVLNDLLLKHLKSMAKKMPLNMLQELFRLIILPNFRSLFPTGKLKVGEISMSEHGDIVNSYLDILYTCVSSHDGMSVSFYKNEGIAALHNLVLMDDYETSLNCVSILKYLSKLSKGYRSDPTVDSSNKTVDRSNKINKSKGVDESFEVTLRELSNASILTVLQVATTQLNRMLDEEETRLFTDADSSLLDVLEVVLELFHGQGISIDTIEPTIFLKCDKLFSRLVDNMMLSSEGKQEVRYKMMDKYVMWLKVLLPIQLIKSVNERSHKELMSMLQKSFLHDNILQEEFGDKVFLTMLNASTICLNKAKATNHCEKDQMFSDMKPASDMNADERYIEKNFKLEETGYEADQDSDESSDYKASSHRTHLFVTNDHWKSKAAWLCHNKLCGMHSMIQVKHPWFIISLLRHLAEKASTEKPGATKIAAAALNLVYECQMLDPANNACLREKKLLLTLLDLYSFAFVGRTQDKKDLQGTLENMIVQLTSITITAVELKIFLELFKVANVEKKCLARILWRICQVYQEHDGPRYQLVFPAVLNKDSPRLQPQCKLQHRTQAFMIPKQESAFRQSKLRTQSLSSMYEMRDSVLKPISYSNQPSSWEASAIQLPLESTFTWPDKEFSLCLWYMLEENGITLYSRSREDSAREKHFLNRQQSITLISQTPHESCGCEELYHLCSLGGSNAMFEVWVGARTGYFQYRWITSCYGSPEEEHLISFDQVIIQHHSEKNQWHHLVVSLVLPSKSQTSEVVSFLDGCKIPTVQMKFPAQCTQSQMKLSLLIGHGVKNDPRTNDVELKKPSYLLKTGVFMVFQGKKSVRERSEIAMATKNNNQPLCDKVKAIYLYCLGPNNSSIDTEYQEYFSNQGTSHMDSSLHWDSIVFKELSFAMSVLSEKLVSDQFPIDLLESPFEVLTNIKTELHSLLMLIFNPRSQKEFLQFIPQLKALGNIQHTYLNEARDLDQRKEGTALSTVPFCKLQLNVMESFKDAIHNCGGISILLYLHALVAEDSNSEEAQSSVLKTVFSVQEKCPFLLREMNDLAGYVLIKRAIQQSPCTMNTALMRALLESACDGNLFLVHDEEDVSFVVVNQNTSAIVKNVCILQMLLKDWGLIKKADFEVQEILWQALETLVRPNHPNVKFNVVQFQRARVVENLLIGCQEVQQEKYFQLPATICRLFIGVITNLLGQPVDLPVLKAVCSFLIAIHPTLDTLTLHSAQNFYLIGKMEATTTANVRLRSPAQRKTKAQRNRRTASFNEADLMAKSPTGSLLNNISPQVILSQENMASGSSVFQSEVIIKRGSSLKSSDKILDVTGDFGKPPDVVKNLGQQYGLDEIDSENVDGKLAASSLLDVGASPAKTPVSMRMKGHRRIQSDGNIKTSSFAIDIPSTSKASENTSTPKMIVSSETYEYDIISDSEVPSSCEARDEYLVVDGFIDQTVESFTPTTAEKEERHNIPRPDVLYHLRLGLMQLLKNTLMLLPDKFVTRVFGNILRVEHLLVLVNQSSDKLREVALENLIIYLQRGGRDCLANFNRFKGCHLLANQLHQHPVTVKIIESCITLLVSKPLTLNQHILEDLEISDDHICLMAIVPCITLLESSIQRPSIFGLFVKFLLKIFDRIEDLPLVAFEHGLADIISNIVCGLSNENSGGMMTSWKKESFGHLLHLLDWMVDKACCTCQTLYFQMYKDLQLSLENIDTREKEKRGAVFPLLSKTCRFLKYYLIQSALNVFKEKNLFMVSVARLPPTKEEGPYVVRPEAYNSARRKSSTARTFIRKLRNSIQMLPPPTTATPSEIQERFQDVLSEAVKHATLFNKSDHTTDVLMFGHKLRSFSYAQAHDREESKAVSLDADREFCKDLLEWFCNSLLIILMNADQNENSSWCALLKSLKDEIIAQANRVFINFVSPFRSKELRLHFVRQVIRYKDQKPMLQALLLNNLISKTRERFLACLYSIISIPPAQLTVDEKEMLRTFEGLIGKSSYFMKINDQKLLSEMSELRHKKREEELLKRKEAYKRMLQRNGNLCESIADHGMEVSKVIVEEQDRQRQRLLRVVRGKVSKDVEVRKTWRNLIHHLTQERALWYNASSYPCSWQLDPTEGPFRMRKRLQRCHLDIAQKFFMDESPAKKLSNKNGLLSYLFTESFDGDQPVFYSFKTNDTIRFLYHCKRVTPATKNAGEVLIGETHMYFVGDEILTDNNVTQAFFGDKDVISISWRYEEIREILQRRYSLQDNALEIFLTSGRTFLLAFENTKSRDEVFEQLMSRELPNLVTKTMDLVTLTNRWKEGHITNFEYLTELNKKAGRSFNDLMQYPVLPFVLANYETNVLDLTSATSFRNLSKPIACQDKSKEERYIENYEYLKADYEQRKVIDPENTVPPYHYSSHYSNSGTVLHFLVRLPPFTSMFLKYQDNQFDIPDRTFHSMSTTWKLSSFISSTDVKELIPEFFFLQEFLQNGERYDMGLRQNKQRVDHVLLPPWCHNNPRLFTLVQMQALESSFISSQIHNWLDLVFGYKQTGQAAIKATNVFHPSTYFGVDVSLIKDTIHRRALQTMIETYGQTPLQLFSQGHPKRFSKTPPTIMEIISSPTTMENKILSLTPKDKEPSNKTETINAVPESISSPIDSVIGVQWGDYCGSPGHSAPVVQWVQAISFSANRIITSESSISAYLCHESACVLPTRNNSNLTKPIGILTWGHHDNMLEISSSNSQLKTTFNPMRPDTVTFCEYVPGLDILFVGGSSGVLNVWPVRLNLTSCALDVVGAKQNLLGHSDAITTICVCQPYSIAVTTSKDKTAIIWDLNRLCYIRSIEGHVSAVEFAAVSESSGDIATACNNACNEGSGHICLWTVNAKWIGEIDVASHVNCLAFSSIPDGIAVNVIAAGMKDGMIKMWDTWTLQPIRSLMANSQGESVISMAFSKWNPLHFFSADNRGNVYLWTSSDIVLQKSPNFVLVAALP